MDQNRWQKIETIVDKALDLHTSERARYIKQATDGDLELIRQVHTLLYYIQRAEEENFLGTRMK